MIGWMVRRAGRLRRLGRHLARLHGDQRGVEAAEWALILVFIAIPLMLFLWWYAGEIKDWVVSIWERARGEVDEGIDEFSNPS